MKVSSPVSKTVQENSNSQAQAPLQGAFIDARPETAALLQLKEAANNSPQAQQLKSLAQVASSAHSAFMVSAHQHGNPVQLEQKQGPGEQGMIDVTEVADYVPNCVDNGELSRKFYRRTSGIASGWNDQDLFYADGDGALVQVTVAMVDAYWNPKYQNFTQLSGPDWTVNCEDYAKSSGFGSKVGDYTNSETLSPLIQSNGNYVINMGYHWMRVIKTGADAVTIRQKDGESAVYGKDFNLADALAYIMNKYGSCGAVYNG